MQDIHSVNPQHIAEQNMVEMHFRFNGDVENQPGGEHAGKDDTHNGILLNSAVIFEIPRGNGAEQPGHECAERQRQSRHPGDYHAGENRVAHGIAHQRPAF